MVSGNYQIAQLVCSRILYTTHLNHKNGSAGTHLNTYAKFKGEKEERCETEELNVRIVQQKKNTATISYRYFTGRFSKSIIRKVNEKCIWAQIEIQEILVGDEKKIKSYGKCN